MLAKDLNHFLSDEAKSRRPSLLKQAMEHFHTPGILSLGGGLPEPEIFPFDELTVKSLKPPFIKGVREPILDNEQTVDARIYKHASDLRMEEDVPLSQALQYGLARGAPPLIEFIKTHHSHIHKMQYEDWDIIISVGNTFSFDGILRTFTNRGDSVLVEEYTFSSSLETIRANGLKAISVKMDLEGVIPSALEEQLAKWEGPKPKLFYLIPTGQNPTGSSLSPARRKAIYEIMQKFDILVVEDEPYYFLQMPAYVLPSERKPSILTRDELCKALVPSFLNFDTDGRVIRLETMSKVLAPGCRLSWAVAQNRFIERFLRLYETTAQQPSGFSQTLINGLLQRWGQGGYLDWIIQIRNYYTEKRDICCDAISNLMPKGKYEFNPPVAGMFFWFKLDARRHKLFEKLGSATAAEIHLYKEGVKNKVLLIPGSWFRIDGMADPEEALPTGSEENNFDMCFRGTFASISAEQLVEAIGRWAMTVNTWID